VTKGEKISKARKAWWAKKKKDDPLLVTERIAAMNRGQRAKGRKRAENNLPSNALRIELRDQQHWYVFLCEECEVNEVWRPCYYFSNRQKYEKFLDIRCRRCSNTHNWDKARKPFESLYSILKTRRDDTSLTFEEFLEFTKVETCCYCDQQVIWAPRGGRGATNLDRKDSSKGYSRKNCVVCCGECNRIKSNKYSYEEMLLIGATLKTIKLLNHCMKH
jgi:hypothetical protein